MCVYTLVCIYLLYLCYRPPLFRFDLLTSINAWPVFTIVKYGHSLFYSWKFEVIYEKVVVFLGFYRVLCGLCSLWVFIEKKNWWVVHILNRESISSGWLGFRGFRGLCCNLGLVLFVGFDYSWFVMESWWCVVWGLQIATLEFRNYQLRLLFHQIRFLFWIRGALRVIFSYSSCLGLMSIWWNIILVGKMF